MTKEEKFQFRVLIYALFTFMLHKVVSKDTDFEGVELLLIGMKDGVSSTMTTAKPPQARAMLNHALSALDDGNVLNHEEIECSISSTDKAARSS